MAVMAIKYLDVQFRPNLRLRVSGRSAVARHFLAEYEPAASVGADGLADLEVRFGDFAEHADALLLRGGHKTVQWAVSVPRAPVPPLTAQIALKGRPTSFGLSLVQGYFVEPLLSLAAVDAGHVLLPCSGIRREDGVVLILGRSGSGKSTLSAWALASGRQLLSDDQVLVEATGVCWPFPRRLRFYSDLSSTVPLAYARLPRRLRIGLGLRRIAVKATKGFVAPPIRVPASTLSSNGPSGGVAMAEAAVIERVSGIDDLGVTDISHDSVVSAAMDILGEQRAKLAMGDHAEWSSHLARVREREIAILGEAVRGATLKRYSIPRQWGAPRAVDALRAHLGF